MTAYSASPSGEKFPLPSEADYAQEMARLTKLAEQARREGKEVVVVMGVGFVGAVMAAIIADTVDKKTGKPSKFVIGCQRPSPRSYWKIPMLNRGESPVKAEDPEVDPMIARCVKEKKTLTATFNSDCLALADCVVVDVQCDYTKHDLGNMRTGEAEMTALEATMRTIGEKVQPHCLTLIETTVAPGTTEFVAWPIMKKAFAARGIASEPLLAHSFERVMPGREYVSSIRDFWRVCSGCNAEARGRVEKFLREVLNTEKFPLTVMDRPIESETTKIVENSYRATILAFLNEWSLFAERNGVDLIKVIKAIKMRPTHSNMIFPGPGIGGYCLPKDGGLGYWAYKHILGLRGRRPGVQDEHHGHRHQRHPRAARRRADARRPAEHGPLHRRGRRAGLRGQLPPGRGRHPLQRLGNGRPQADRDGGRNARPRPLRRSLVRTGIAGHVPRPRPFLGAVLPQPGGPEGHPRAERPGRRAPARRGADPGRAARAVPEARSRGDRPLGRRAAGGDRLLRHPLGRQDPPLLRAGLRGEGPRPRPHPADQGAGPGAAGVSRLAE